MSSIWGDNFKISVFGESHGSAIGVVIDGVPPGLKIDMDEIMLDMGRRAPGNLRGATTRKEADIPNIVSGVKNGFATGAPLCAIIQNTSQRSRDYGNLENTPRPGHADFTAMHRYGGFADLRGGGHFSGRLTAPIVFAGAVARAFLKQRGVSVGSHILRIGNVTDSPFDPLNVDAITLEKLRARTPAFIDNKTAVDADEVISGLKGDSVGGVIECAALGLIPGLGDPMFNGVEGKIASLLFSIPAVKGVEFGAGFEFGRMQGSIANDSMCYEDGSIRFKSNNCGGILGGITTGTPVIVRIAVKPTPSISLEQDTVDVKIKSDTRVSVTGRHDACIALRFPPVAEAAVLIALADMVLQHGDCSQNGGIYGIS